mgnify:CR=1 FL=1
MNFCRERVLSRITPRFFYRVTDRNGSVVKLKGKRGGQLCDFLSCTYEHGFCLVVVKL